MMTRKAETALRLEKKPRTRWKRQYTRAEQTLEARNSKPMENKKKQIHAGWKPVKLETVTHQTAATDAETQEKKIKTVKLLGQKEKNQRKVL